MHARGTASSGTVGRAWPRRARTRGPGAAWLPGPRPDLPPQGASRQDRLVPRPAAASEAIAAAEVELASGVVVDAQAVRRAVDVLVDVLVGQVDRFERQREV